MKIGCSYLGFVLYLGGFTFLWRIIFPSLAHFFDFYSPFLLPIPIFEAIFNFSSSTPCFAGLCAVACLSRLIYKFNIRHFSNLLVGIIFHFTLLSLSLPLCLAPHARLTRIFLMGNKKMWEVKWAKVRKHLR